MVTLTVKEIADIAEVAGLTIKSMPTGDDLETEFTITDCPVQGVKGDDDVMRHYGYIVYCTEYPEEGCIPLGDEINVVKA